MRNRGASVLALACTVLPACGARSALDPLLHLHLEGEGDDGVGDSPDGGSDLFGDGGTAFNLDGQSRKLRGPDGRVLVGADEGGTGTGGGPSGSGCNADDGPLPPSCAPGGPGMTNCGPCMESCCSSLEVVGGTYERTYMNMGNGPSGEADPATVSGLRLDKYLVTVGRFRQFVAAWNQGAGWNPAEGSGKHTHLNGGKGLADESTPGAFEPGWNTGDDGWIGPTDEALTSCSVDTWTSAPGMNENLPINCMNWWEAYAFCIWDGAFLPSEAEWEYAAAGGSDERAYPWGDTQPGSNDVLAIYGYEDGNDCYFPMPGACSGVANIAPVGTASKGGGVWAQLDLAGDMGEWVLDWFAPYDACVDCTEVESATYRSIRGGAYDDVASGLAPPLRGGRIPPGRNPDVGFRCARVP